MSWISRVVVIFTALVLIISCKDNKATQTVFSEKEQIGAVNDLIDRVTSGRSSEFVVHLLPARQDSLDFFEFGTENGKIMLGGNNGVSIASALGHYLREYCGYHLSWCGSDTVLPETLPLPEKTITKTSP